MEIIRLYKLADAEMFSYADKVISNLQTDIALFSNFDATIDGAFVTQAWNLLNTAKALPTDNVVLDQQVAITEQVKILMQDCRDQYDDMKFFIKKAFKNSVGRQNEFGLNDYNKAMINASEMVRFLDDMYNTPYFFLSKDYNIFISINDKLIRWDMINEILGNYDFSTDIDDTWSGINTKEFSTEDWFNLSLIEDFTTECVIVLREIYYDLKDKLSDDDE